MDVDTAKQPAKQLLFLMENVRKSELKMEFRLDWDGVEIHFNNLLHQGKPAAPR